MLPPCHFLLYSSNAIVTLTEETIRSNHSDTKKLDHFTVIQTVPTNLSMDTKMSTHKGNIQVECFLYVKGHYSVPYCIVKILNIYTLSIINWQNGLD